MAAKSNAMRKSEPGPELFSPAKSATQLDRLIHERLRLGILSALAAEKSLTFSELKTLLGSTDGNLSVHARKLEEAELYHLRERLRGTGAALRIPDHIGGAQGPRKVSGSHGNADSCSAGVDVNEFGDTRRHHYGR